MNLTSRTIRMDSVRCRTAFQQIKETRNNTYSIKKGNPVFSLVRVLGLGQLLNCDVRKCDYP